MSELSPAAQAVVDAASEVYWDWENMVPSVSYTIAAAAALRAAVDQVVPLRLPPERATDADGPTIEWHAWNAEQQARFALLAIAAELEAQ